MGRDGSFFHGHPLIDRRREIDQLVLANLLRLNQELAG